MKTTILAVALAVSAAASALPAQADPPPWAPAHGRRAHDEAAREDARDAYDRGAYDRSDRRAAEAYDSRGRYVEPRVITRNDRMWRGSDGRYYCRRSNGTTGLVIGAAAGALVGHELAGRGDRTLGTVLGAAAGGLLGREVDRGSLKCR
ncbi:MAG: glycine zipper 2TM domain-containing protein [Caulobacterales bacterium]|nr:glycine zipper 2TM domain-containing protein [Caulobacterales bacterium]